MREDCSKRFQTTELITFCLFDLPDEYNWSVYKNVIRAILDELVDYIRLYHVLCWSVTDGEEVNDEEQARVSAGSRELHGLEYVRHSEAFYRSAGFLHQTQLAGRLRTTELPGDRRGPAVYRRGFQLLAATDSTQLQRSTDRPSWIIRRSLHTDHQPTHQAQPCQGYGLSTHFYLLGYLWSSVA